jgi:cytoskeletal protein RodZ
MSSFGEDLRRERELRQISLREISEATKISLRYLDALERNDFRHLPGGVFNKGFVRAYSQYIGVDPETMVNAYLLEEKGQEARSRESKGPAGRQVADSQAAARQVADGRKRGLWLLVSGLLLLLAACAVLTFLAIRYWRSPARGDGRSHRDQPRAVATSRPGGVPKSPA